MDSEQEDNTTEESCIKALQYAADKLGHQPRLVEYKGLEVYPAATTIVRIFGTWNEAIEAAGFEPQTDGGNHPNWRLAGTKPPEERDVP